GREFLNLCASIRGNGREKINSLAEKFGVADKLDEQICTYSKGTAQKIGLIQALMHEPPALVLDEPFTGLDIPSRVALKELLRERAKAGCAIIVSVHEPETAQELCARIGIMKNGKLALCGSPSAVIRTAGASNLESAFMHVVG
ncbi:MAG: ATP-binding cassette domain-containing protein, partial [Candidatus Thermoplasmatota archaeon]|nr:ATP-binding cassette domain-containing protein [Candidatus Thermoplasmatota archaeon]